MALTQPVTRSESESGLEVSLFLAEPSTDPSSGHSCVLWQAALQGAVVLGSPTGWEIPVPSQDTGPPVKCEASSPCLYSHLPVSVYNKVGDSAPTSGFGSGNKDEGEDICQTHIIGRALETLFHSGKRSSFPDPGSKAGEEDPEGCYEASTGSPPTPSLSSPSNF